MSSRLEQDFNQTQTDRMEWDKYADLPPGAQWALLEEDAAFRSDVERCRELADQDQAKKFQLESQ